MSRWEMALSGGRAVARLLTSALWVAVAVALFAAGSVAAGILCLAYVSYLLFFGGRLLLY